jgi:RNA polymerase sigma-70 factor (ECF subfamily)
VTDVTALLDHLFRRQSAQIVATLTRSIGGRHLSLAEEAVQDALVTALQQWPFGGVPRDPAGWLYRVARNRALDRLRHAQMADGKAASVAALQATTTRGDVDDVMLAGEPAPMADDQLGLIFMTCHPVLSRDARVALTLKVVGGFGVAEIARAFVVQPPAVAQRLVRAKRLLRDRDVPFGPPAPSELADRLDSVLEVLYLLFNEGYAVTSGDRLICEDISAEAIRLAGLLTRHPLTATPRSWALLALLLLHAARFRTRVGDTGDVLQLRDQDRTRWDRTLISEGLQALDRAASGDVLSTFHLEAEIAACHAVAPSWAETDWTRIVQCYDELVGQTNSPIVRLNRAIARSRVDGPHAAISEIESLVGLESLASYHLLPAALAELWREAGDPDRAASYNRAALRLAGSSPERRLLAGRLEGA